MIASAAVSLDVAAWCGIAAPLLLGGYLELGCRLRKGYDKSRDTMSKLGDGTDVTAFGFLLVNLVVGGLLVVFARWAVEPTLGDVWYLVAATAVGSIVIGLSAGKDFCRIPGFHNIPIPGLQGRPSPLFHAAHVAAAAANVVLMGIVPVVVQLGSRVESTPQSFRAVNLAVAWTFPIALVCVAAMTLVGDRQLRDRLLKVSPRGRRRYATPWDEPRFWFDRLGIGERVLWVIGYSWVIAVSVLVLRPGWIVGSVVAFDLAALFVIFRRKGVIVPRVRFTVESCQRNTVHGPSKKPWGEYRFLQITDPDRFRACLGELLDEEEIAWEETRRNLKKGGRAERRREQRRPSRDRAVTIGFTRAGLDTLRVPYQWTSKRRGDDDGGAVVDPFGAGMVSRADVLGDAPFDDGWAGVHAAVWCRATSDETLRLGRKAMNRLDGATNVVGPFSSREYNAEYNDPRLLGFTDGISQPWILGVPDPRAGHPRGGGKLSRWGSWQPLATGEFILGQVDEANDVFPVPEPAPLFLGATFAAVRQIELDSGRLQRVVDRFVERGEPADEALEKLVGRRFNGDSLDPSNPKRQNLFRFADDPFGMICPVTAHIRRSNPRDALGFETQLANRRRMLRRGGPYVRDADDLKSPLAGVMFVAMQARLDDQFEFVQRHWLNDGAAFGLGRDPDVIAGTWQGSRQLVLPSTGVPVAVEVADPVVTVRGGAYLVVPSIRGLYYLARSPERA